VETIEVKGGWVIRCVEGTHVGYLGRDGYWCRTPEGCTPFTTEQDAYGRLEDEQAR
jgi:hypothetical protein